jgi:hypothetical protein
MKQSTLFFAVVAVACIAAGAQAPSTPPPDSSAILTPRAEYTGAYSYVRWGDFNYNGVAGTAIVNLNRWVGLVGDIGFAPGYALGVKETLATYWGGPRVSWRTHNRVTPYAQFLIGGAHYGVRVDSNGFRDSGSGPAWSMGLGLNARMNRHISVRVFQLDYVSTYFDDGRSGFARVTTGWVFH